MADLYSLLAGTMGGDNEYLASDPYFLSGRSIAQSPLPVAHSNAEAILGPLLSGLAAGGLMGYGERHSKRTAWDQAKLNRLLQGDAATASGTNYSGDMPEKWSPNVGRADAIFKALSAQSALDAAQKRQEIKDKVFAEAEAQRELLKGTPYESVAGLPTNIQKDVIDQRQVAADRSSVEAQVAAEFKKAKDTTRIFGMLPGKTADALAGGENVLLTAYQKLTGRETNEPVRNDIKRSVPDWNDTDAQIDAKAKLFAKIVASAGKSDSGMLPSATPTPSGLPTPKYFESDLTAAGYSASDIAALRAQGVVQ